MTIKIQRGKAMVRETGWIGTVYPDGSWDIRRQGDPTVVESGKSRTEESAMEIVIAVLDVHEPRR